MPTCLVGLGSNLGDRATTLEEAVRRLRAEPDITVRAVSRWIETAPVGGPSNQPRYLNGVVRLETSLSPGKLLRVLKQIEVDAGRVQDERWGPRTLDLDLLLYGDEVYDISRPKLRLQVPHPRMAFRRFVLEPAQEIASDMVHPTTGWTIERLWRHLCEAPNYLALAGLPGKEKSRFAQAVCDAASAELICGYEEELLSRLESSAGPVESVAIEFLERWAELLRVPPAGSAWRVSDFYLAQLPFLVAPRLNESQLHALRARCQAVANEVLQPKLVVVVAPSKPKSEDKGLFFELPRAISGPWFWVSMSEEQSAVAEVVAAMEGMARGQ
jgi:2-amino-4-hydroxy-6-hydroxymethyldihydropteridine diphosphokinase